MLLSRTLDETSPSLRASLWALVAGAGVRGRRVVDEVVPRGEAARDVAEGCGVVGVVLDTGADVADADADALGVGVFDVLDEVVEVLIVASGASWCVEPHAVRLRLSAMTGNVFRTFFMNSSVLSLQIVRHTRWPHGSVDFHRSYWCLIRAFRHTVQDRYQRY